MLNENIFLGLPLNFGSIKIYPPTVKQVTQCENFFKYAKILTIEEDEIDEEINKDKGEKDKIKITPLEYIIGNSYNNSYFKQILEEAFLFFTREKITFIYTEKKIAVGDFSEDIKTIEDLKKITVLSEENFLDFQNKVREALGYEIVKKEEPITDTNPAVRRIKMLARERERKKKAILRKKAEKDKDDEKSIKFSTVLTAICCMGIGLTPLNIGEISYAAVQPIMKMMQDKEKYNLDVKQLLAGADNKKVKPVYWIKNFKN